MTEKPAKIRHGTIGSDGRLFWGYNKRCINGEYWVSLEQFNHLKELAKQERQRNSARIKAYFANRRKTRLAEVREIERKSQIRHRAKNYIRLKNYAINNRDKVNASKNKWKRKARLNPIYRVHSSISTRLRIALKRNSQHKDAPIISILGCSLDFFKHYLKARFKKGMTWDNYGKWHIDHIIPISSAANKREVIKLSHYSNLQPLWAKENLIKHNKIYKQTEFLGSLPCTTPPTA